MWIFVIGESDHPRSGESFHAYKYVGPSQLFILKKNSLCIVWVFFVY